MNGLSRSWHHFRSSGDVFCTYSTFWRSFARKGASSPHSPSHPPSEPTFNAGNRTSQIFRHSSPNTTRFPDAPLGFRGHPSLRRRRSTTQPRVAEGAPWVPHPSDPRTPKGFHSVPRVRGAILGSGVQRRWRRNRRGWWCVPRVRCATLGCVVERRWRTILRRNLVVLSEDCRFFRRIFMPQSC